MQSYPEWPASVLRLSYLSHLAYWWRYSMELAGWPAVWKPVGNPVDVSFVFVFLIKQRTNQNEEHHWEEHGKLVIHKEEQVSKWFCATVENCSCSAGNDGKKRQQQKKYHKPFPLQLVKLIFNQHSHYASSLWPEVIISSYRASSSFSL